MRWLCHCDGFIQLYSNDCLLIYKTFIYPASRVMPSDRDLCGPMYCSFLHTSQSLRLNMQITLNWNAKLYQLAPVCLFTWLRAAGVATVRWCAADRVCTQETSGLLDRRAHVDGFYGPVRCLPQANLETDDTERFGFDSNKAAGSISSERNNRCRCATACTQCCTYLYNRNDSSFLVPP